MVVPLSRSTRRDESMATSASAIFLSTRAFAADTVSLINAVTGAPRTGLGAAAGNSTALSLRGTLRLAATALPGRPANTADESALAAGGTGDAFIGVGGANTITRFVSRGRLA